MQLGEKHKVLKSHHFMFLLFSSRCENPLCMVKESTWNREIENKVIVDFHTPLNSIHFFMVSKFLLFLCPKCLDKQASKCLLATASRTRRATEAHVMLYWMSDHQEGKLVDNRYALKKAWKDMWGHHVGGKFAYRLI
jgi:hypothetical protein